MINDYRLPIKIPEEPESLTPGLQSHDRSLQPCPIDTTASLRAACRSSQLKCRFGLCGCRAPRWAAITPRYAGESAPPRHSHCHCRRSTIRPQAMSSNLARDGRRRRFLNEEVRTASSLSLAARTSSRDADAETPRYGEQAGIEHHPQITDFVPRRKRALLVTLAAGLGVAAATQALAHFRPERRRRAARHPRRPDRRSTRRRPGVLDLRRRPAVGRRAGPHHLLAPPSPRRRLPRSLPRVALGCVGGACGERQRGSRCSRPGGARGDCGHRMVAHCRRRRMVARSRWRCPPSGSASA